ncbi:MAG: SWIM zinc finger family protein [Planctomycetota bacterium]|jgi:uncharacterized Zn finger protein
MRPGSGRRSSRGSGRNPARGSGHDSGRQFAETWWGARWIQALERLGGGWSNRLPRGRQYARSGAVKNLRFVEGEIEATVQGTAESPYEVQIGLPNLADEVWDRVLKKLTGKALYAAKLLSGEMPRDVQAVFSACRASLFPRRPSELRTSCTCPDDTNPCKHVAATHYVLAETLDADPFLLFELRGRTKPQILTALRELRGRRASTIHYKAAAEAAAVAAEQAAEDEPPPINPDAYGRAREDLTTLGFHVAAPDVAVGAIRALGPPRSWPDPKPFLRAFYLLYRDASALALDFAWGSEEEIPESARLPKVDDEELLEAMASSMPKPVAPGSERKPPGFGGPRSRRSSRRRRRGGRSRRRGRKSGGTEGSGGGGSQPRLKAVAPPDAENAEGSGRKRRRRRRRGRRGRGRGKKNGDGNGGNGGAE